GPAVELAHVDAEPGAAQMVALEGVGKRVLVHDLAARHVEDHAARFHCGETLRIEEPRGLGRPLAADDHEVAFREIAVEIGGPADLDEAGRQQRVGFRLAPRAYDAHAERRAPAADPAARAGGAPP